MDITFANLQTKVQLNPLPIRRSVKKILQHEGVHPAALSLVFVSRQKIQALNQKYLGRSYATDVLAFDLRAKGGKRGRRDMCAEIIISMDAARKNAHIYQTPLGQETVLYVIHGILHLLGFDDHESKATGRMRAKEQELLKLVGGLARKVVVR